MENGIQRREARHVRLPNPFSVIEYGLYHLNIYQSLRSSPFVLYFLEDRVSLSQNSTGYVRKSLRTDILIVRNDAMGDRTEVRGATLLIAWWRERFPLSERQLGPTTL